MKVRSRRRKSNNCSNGESGNAKGEDTADSDDSEEEESLTLSENKVEELTRVLPQSSDQTTAVLDSALASLQPRWRNWTVRFIFSFLMIDGFIFIIYLGPLALMGITLLIQVKCFHEVMSVGYVVYSVDRFPWLRSLSWYFLFTSNYFFYGESLINYFGILYRLEFMQFLVAYHRFISFSFYILGFVLFVLGLVKKCYMRQFNLFAWTHVSLLIVVTQSYMILQNLFEGIIWFIVPVSMIICNDIFAYICGFFFGKTPLIQLSPKKTWEGFIGGAVFTVIFGFIVSYLFCQFEYFVCPVEYPEAQGFSTPGCTPSSVFQLTEYPMPSFVAMVFRKLGFSESIHVYPFVFHSLALSLFSSIIGPFGGFFASGFKRAFKVKDFGNVIPGHGGLTDRFDCQLLMATFVNVYIYSFIRSPDMKSMLKQIYSMENSLQLKVFRDMNKTLIAKGLL